MVSRNSPFPRVSRLSLRQSAHRVGSPLNSAGGRALCFQQHIYCYSEPWGKLPAHSEVRAFLGCTLSALGNRAECFSLKGVSTEGLAELKALWGKAEQSMLTPAMDWIKWRRWSYQQKLEIGVYEKNWGLTHPLHMEDWDYRVQTRDARFWHWKQFAHKANCH